MVDKQIERELMNAISSINNLAKPIENIPRLFDEVKKLQQSIEKFDKTIYIGNGEKALTTTVATHGREHDHADKRMNSHQEQIDWLRDTMLVHIKNDIHNKRNVAQTKTIFSNKVKLAFLSAVLTLIGGILVKNNWDGIGSSIVSFLKHLITLI